MSDVEALSAAPLSALANEVGGEIGTAFLERVVFALRRAMDARMVLVTVGNGNPATRAEATYALKDGMPKAGIAYNLQGTPCHCVYRGETFTVPRALAQQFPRESGWEGYVGVPIRDHENRVVGNFAVFSESPIVMPQMATDIVKIFGARIEAEMRHKTLIAEREQLIDRLQSLNESMELRNQALHEANQFKTSVMGMVAHDIRNPLAAIVAKVELMQARLGNGRFDAEKAEVEFEKIMANADRLSGIIDATLARCRSESARIAIRPRETDATSLVRQAVSNNAEDAARKDIAIRLEADGPVMALLDETLCLEAIDNLIGNAVKYSPPATEITARVEVGHGAVTVHVQDQGQGMTQSDLSYAFGAFQILSAKPTGGESATGLGLSNVRQIARAHGGDVTAASDGPGKGAIFSLRLPLRSDGSQGQLARSAG